jgi:hypothetical protein
MIISSFGRARRQKPPIDAWKVGAKRLSAKRKTSARGPWRVDRHKPPGVGTCVPVVAIASCDRYLR